LRIGACFAFDIVKSSRSIGIVCVSTASPSSVRSDRPPSKRVQRLQIISCQFLGSDAAKLMRAASSAAASSCRSLLAPEPGVDERPMNATWSHAWSYSKPWSCCGNCFPGAGISFALGMAWEAVL